MTTEQIIIAIAFGVLPLVFIIAMVIVCDLKAKALREEAKDYE